MDLPEEPAAQFPSQGKFPFLGKAPYNLNLDHLLNITSLVFCLPPTASGPEQGAPPSNFHVCLSVLPDTGTVS